MIPPPRPGARAEGNCEELNAMFWERQLPAAVSRKELVPCTCEGGAP